MQPLSQITIMAAWVTLVPGPIKSTVTEEMGTGMRSLARRNTMALVDYGTGILVAWMSKSPKAEGERSLQPDQLPGYP
jgi:hypothetical protein